MNKEINLKSSTLEKGLEIAKDFIDKLIMPSVEETGLLVKDHITMWRFQNQIKILTKAKFYCEQHNIKSKKISLKILAPLIEYSSLEEDNLMQDKWSILLSNLVDSEQNIENHVFPYILSQLSIDEFLFLEKIYDNRIAKRINLISKLEELEQENKEEKTSLQIKIDSLLEQINFEKKESKDKWSVEIWKLGKKTNELQTQLRNVEHEEWKIKSSINASVVIDDGTFYDFEVSNLTRLGLVKEIKEFYAENQTLEIPIERERYEHSSDYTNVELKIEVKSNLELVLTELGELFFKACKEKNSNIVKTL